MKIKTRDQPFPADQADENVRGLVRTDARNAQDGTNSGTSFFGHLSQGIMIYQTQKPTQRPFVEDNHMVQILAADSADHPLNVRTLLRRSWRSQHFLNAELFHLMVEISTEDAVAV